MCKAPTMTYGLLFAYLLMSQELKDRTELNWIQSINFN